MKDQRKPTDYYPDAATLAVEGATIIRVADETGVLVIARRATLPPGAPVEEGSLHPIGATRVVYRDRGKLEHGFELPDLPHDTPLGVLHRLASTFQNLVDAVEAGRAEKVGP